MDFGPSSQSHDELERHVHLRTGRRVRNLAVEVCDERVILRGRASSYYVKQLAQHGVRDLLPTVVLENTIVVDDEAPRLTGVAAS